jgi:hypothetical protein
MEITIKIDERKKEAKALLEFLKNLSFVEISSSKPRYNKETEEAIKDVKLGKTEKVSLATFRNQLYS